MVPARIRVLRAPRLNRLPAQVSHARHMLQVLDGYVEVIATTPAQIDQQAFANACFEALKFAAELHRDLEVLAMDAGVPPTLIADEVY